MKHIHLHSKDKGNEGWFDHNSSTVLNEKIRIVLSFSSYETENLDSKTIRRICRLASIYKSDVFFESLLPIPILSVDLTKTNQSKLRAVITAARNLDLRLICSLETLSYANHGDEYFMEYGPIGCGITEIVKATFLLERKKSWLSEAVQQMLSIDSTPETFNFLKNKYCHIERLHEGQKEAVNDF